MNRISRGCAFRPKTLMLLFRFSFLILSSAAIMTLALESSKFSRKKRYSTLFHTVLGMSSDSKVKKSTKPTQIEEKRSHSYPPGNKPSKHGKLLHKRGLNDSQSSTTVMHHFKFISNIF